MSGEIHHRQGGQDPRHGEWQADNTPGRLPAETGEGASVRRGHGRARARQEVDLQRDVQSSADVVETRSRNDVHRVATGFRYATLSQNQLDGADPTQPRITDVRLRVAAGALPGGPAGTGNPFFKPNPMVTFFTTFLTLLQTMKWLQKVATKLTVIQMQGVKDTGLAQAQATLNAGKAQAAADRAQGIVSAFQAAVSGIQLGASVVRDFQISKRAGASMKNEQKLASDMEEDAMAQKDNISKARSSLNARRNVLDNKPDVSFKKADGSEINPQASRLEKKREAKLARQKAEQEYSEAQEDFKKSLQKSKSEDVKEASKGREEVLAKRDKLEIKAKRQEEAREADEFYEMRLDAKGDTKQLSAHEERKLKRQIDRDNNTLLHAQGGASASSQKATEHWEQAKGYDFKGTELKAWQMRAQLKQTDTVWLGIQMGGQTINHILDTIKMFFKATGEEQSAYYQSYGQIMATYNQMIKTGLDSTINLNRDAYQQGGDLCQTLIKMSDQEAQSMHWAA